MTVSSPFSTPQPSPPPSSVIDYASGERRTLRFFLRPAFLLVLILAFAATLRVVRIGHYSMWLDEMLALEDSTGRGQMHMELPSGTLLDPAPALTRIERSPGFFRIWTSLGRETHPPLYFMLLNLWRHVAGEGDVAARVLSLVMSLVSILLLYQVARLLHGPIPALWACMILAVAGPQIQYSQEARPYTFLLVLMLCAALALVRIEKLGVTRWRVIGLGTSVLAMLLTHYLAGAAVGGLGLYALVRLRGTARRDAILAFVAAAFIFAAAWGPFLLEQKRRFWAEHVWMLEGNTSMSWGNAWRTLERICQLPIRFFTEPMKDSQAIGGVSCVIYVLPLLLLPKRRDLLLWCLLLLTPVLGVAMSDVARGAWATGIVRYSFLATAPAYVIIAAMLAHQTGWLRHVLPLVVFVSCIAAIERAYWRSMADWRIPSRILEQRVLPGDIVLFTTLGPRDWQSRGLYLMMSHYAPLSVTAALLDAPPAGELAQAVAQAQHVWVVSRSFEPRYQHFLPGCRVKQIFPDPECGTIAEVAMSPSAPP